MKERSRCKTLSFAVGFVSLPDGIWVLLNRDSSSNLDDAA